MMITTTTTQVDNNEDNDDDAIVQRENGERSLEARGRKVSRGRYTRKRIVITKETALDESSLSKIEFSLKNRVLHSIQVVVTGC